MFSIKSINIKLKIIFTAFQCERILLCDLVLRNQHSFYVLWFHEHFPPEIKSLIIFFLFTIVRKGILHPFIPLFIYYLLYDIHMFQFTLADVKSGMGICLAKYTGYDKLKTSILSLEFIKSKSKLAKPSPPTKKKKKKAYSFSINIYSSAGELIHQSIQHSSNIYSFI